MKHTPSRRAFLGAVPAALAGFGSPSVLAEPGQRRAASSGGVLGVSLRAGTGWVGVGRSLGRLDTYNGVLPGPVLEARAGDTVRVRLSNELGEPTNLHFHGLHVTPSGRGDNVFLEIPPGEEFAYEFEIPARHPAGLFWYHPHLHGSTARQVFRGLAGVFVIRGEMDEAPELAEADEHLVVLQDLGLNQRGEVPEASMMERMNGREGSMVLSSGALNPALRIRAGGLARLRLLNASPSRFYRLRVEEHAMHVIGTDGGALEKTQTVDELLLSPGERADVLVKGERTGGEFRLLNLPYNRGGMGMGGMAMGGISGTGAAELVATLRYEGWAEQEARVPERWASIERLAAPEGPARRFVLSEGGMGMRGMRFLINGRGFDHQRVDTRVRLGSVEEWEIVNAGGMDHPFHVHTNPFQVVDETGLARREWKDVVLVPAGQRRRIRTRFEDFTGKAVYHCHILDHEDLGMMGTLEFAEGE